MYIILSIANLTYFTPSVLLCLSCVCLCVCVSVYVCVYVCVCGYMYITYVNIHQQISCKCIVHRTNHLLHIFCFSLFLCVCVCV